MTRNHHHLCTASPTKNFIDSKSPPKLCMARPILIMSKVMTPQMGFRLYGTFPDDVDCGVFWKCQDGKPNKYNCPPGLAYDSVILCPRSNCFTLHLLRCPVDVGGRTRCPNVRPIRLS